MKLIRIIVIAALLLIIAGGYAYQQLKLETDRFISEDPRVWEPVIAGFEQQDLEIPPPRDAILFIGSSTIRFWDDLSEDMQPMTALGRGFGGAKIADLAYFADRLVKPYRPRAIVVYIGANDFSDLLGNRVKSLQQGQQLYGMLIERLHHAAPDKPVYLLALRPRPAEPQLDELITRVNHFLASATEGDEYLHFIDANAVFLKDNGQFDEQFASWDSLHINRRGYQAWGDAIRQRLLADLGN